MLTSLRSIFGNNLHRKKALNKRNRRNFGTNLLLTSALYEDQLVIEKSRGYVREIEMFLAIFEDCLLTVRSRNQHRTISIGR